MFSRMLVNRAVQLGLARAPELEEDPSGEDGDGRVEGTQEGRLEQEGERATGVSGVGESTENGDQAGEGGEGEGRSEVGQSEEPRKRRKKVRPFLYLWDERLTSQAAKISISTKTMFYKCRCPSWHGLFQTHGLCLGLRNTSGCSTPFSV